MEQLREVLVWMEKHKGPDDWPEWVSVLEEAARKYLAFLEAFDAVVAQRETLGEEE